jgi:hypothetical protein
MHIDQATYRELCNALLACEGADPSDSILRPWLDCASAERQWLSAFAARAGDPIPPASVEDQWRLYALSRVHDLLIYDFQPEPPAGDRWAGPRVGGEDYLFFMRSLSFTPTAGPAYHPFFHEVVGVEQAADPSSPPTVIKTLWPAMMLGPMLFARAGVVVHAGASHLRKDVAESSTLYWAWRRRGRPCDDMSAGWGHNSQWRTRYRRDYRLGGWFHFNVDGPIHVDDPPTAAGESYDGGLVEPARTEVVVHRCFVVTDGPHDDQFPYDLRLSLPDSPPRQSVSAPEPKAPPP